MGHPIFGRVALQWRRYYRRNEIVQIFGNANLPLGILQEHQLDERQNQESRSAIYSRALDSR